MSRVATSLILNSDGDLLILKRSDKVRTYKGFWGGVAGYIEKNENPIETAYKEIKEEVGLEKEDVQLIKKINPIKIIDFYEEKRYDWEIYVFIFKTVVKNKIKIDWEHSEYRWINPSKIEKFKTVPYLKDIVEKNIL
jgi:8-oxo-dGTP pyrophosphatase MutT (NUDIX family)